MFLSLPLHPTSMSEHHSIAFSLTARSGAAALEFYQRAFGAEVVERFDTPEGGLPHAELRIGNTCFYLSDESPRWHAAALPPGVLAPCVFALRVPDIAAAFRRAVEAGATVLIDFEDEPGPLLHDPFGYRWTFHPEVAAPGG